MKKINLIRLLVLMMVLITSIPQMWAVTVNGGKFYFDATNFSTTTVVQFAFIKCGNDPYSEYCGMSNVTNTKLYYYNRTGAWGGLWYIAVIGNGSSWSSGNHCANVGNASSYTNTYNADYTFNNGDAYYLYTPSNTAGDLTPSYGVPSKKQTVITYLNGSQASTSPARIKIDSYYKSGDGTSCATNSTVTTNRGGSYSSSYDCIVTAKTTVKVDDIASGVTFVGWYKTDGTLLSTNTSYTYYGSTDNTIHARFENRYSVTVNAGSNGTITTPAGGSGSSVTAGYYTSASIAASANNGYYFTNWTRSNTKVTFANSNAASTTITATGTATVTANFAARWVLRGSKDAEEDPVGGMPGWSTTTANMTAGTTTTRDVTLEPNTRYKYRIYDKKNPTLNSSIGCGATGDGNQTLGSSWTLNGTKDAHFVTRGYGTYRFSVTVNASDDRPSVTISPQFTSYQITIGTKTQSSGAASASPGTGGTVSAKDGDNFTIVNGNYVKQNGSVTFTASPNVGYSFVGWYSTDACTGVALSTNRVYSIADVTGAQTVYALFEEQLFSVTVLKDGSTPTTETVGVASHPSITAIVPSGKVFDRWVLTGSVSVASSAAQTTNITGVSDNQSVITATFKELPKIYIDATSATGWSPSNMYVVFYKNGGYFDGNKGTGLSSTYVINSLPLKMTKVDGKKIWYYSYDPTSGVFAGKTITCVAFVDHTFEANYGNFTSCTAVYRTDFNSCMNMFVVTDNTGTNKNDNCYYRNTNAINDDAGKGYWRNYDEKNSGFYLNNLPGGSVEFTNTDASNTSYTATVNLDGGRTYYFYVGGCNGWNWRNDQGSYPFNYSNKEREIYPYGDVSSDANRCKLTTTSGGYYTFTLTPKRSGRTLGLKVSFPGQTNDYRAVYNNAASSPTIKRPSNIISQSDNSGTISLWLNKGTNYITFQKCSIASGGAVTWSSVGSQQTVTGVPEAGVYTMTLTRNSSTSYTVSTPQAYTGNYYIRTDCATGDWTDYKLNILEKNTINYDATDSKTFNYYFCKWINDAGTNVRCVIANEYNMAISDTLKSETILDNKETLPYAANVRFSYNTATNELKRSYLNGANDWHANFLTLEGNNKTWKYNDDETNLGTATMVDQNNWIYTLDIKAQGGARGRLIGTYNEHQQPFVGDLGDFSDETTEVLLGGTSSSKHTIRMTYDFKTNHLLSAWLINNDVINATQTISTDIMIVRKHQEESKQLTFQSGKSLTEVHRAYGVMQFNKWLVNNQSEAAGHSSLSKSIYERSLYFVSFPFNVKLSEAFGFGNYGEHWIIERYDGYNRARKGFWADSDPNWKYVLPTERNTFVLNAYEGYILALDLSKMVLASSIWNNNVEDVYLYFPSQTLVGSITTGDINVDIDTLGYQCTINRGTEEGDRRVKDSHWHCIGVPGYSNYSNTLTDNHSQTVSWSTTSIPYIYDWNMTKNELTATATSTYNFKAMHAYLVQYRDVKLKWTGINRALAARRFEGYKDVYEFRLEMRKDDQFVDQTYVSLRDNEGVTNGFDFNFDLSKEFNSGDNIYTKIGYESAAGNCLPLETEQVTTVPVGVVAKADGSYTFAMPDGTEGLNVTLYDSQANKYIDLSIEDYTLDLTAGTYDNRFYLTIDPRNSATMIDVVGGEGEDVEAAKIFRNGLLYIQRSDKLYDARGSRIE